LILLIIVTALTLAVASLWLEVQKLRGRALRSEILLKNLYLEAEVETTPDEGQVQETFNYGNLKGMFAHGTEHREESQG